ncbi:FkbM family methyltransferase [Roseibium sp.]|uniref:FkbM family methyltransferase n=1 Tax=Roseibium sp. TaxID=1936156 RepID=UPI003A970CFA
MTKIDARTTEVEARHGVMDIFPLDDPIGVSVARYGEWAQFEIEALACFIARGDTIIDVGANIGTHTLALARHIGPEGRIIAYEPQPVVAEVLCGTLVKNGITWGSVRQACVGGEAGDVALPEVDYSGHVNVGAVSFAAGAGGTTMVPVETLNSLQLETCSFVKVDAEGMGHLVLEGMQDLIAQFRPTVAFEINDIEEAALTTAGWKTEDYRKYFLRTPCFNPDNLKGSPDNLFGLSTETMLLFVPVEKLSLVDAVRAPKYIAPVETLDAIASELLLSPRYGDHAALDNNTGYKLLYDRLSQQMEHQQRESRARSAQAQNDLDQLKQGLKRVQYQAARLAREASSVPSRFTPVLAETVTVDAEGLKRLEDDTSVAPAQVDTVPAADVPATQPAAREAVPLKLAAKKSSFTLFKRAAGILRKRGYTNADRALLAGSALFDLAFYRAQDPSIPDNLDQAAAHYLRKGAVEGLDPGPDFSTKGYQALYPDILRNRINPLLHYLKSGESEGRRLLAAADYVAAESLVPGLPESGLSIFVPDIDAIDGSTLFDEAFYTTCAEDVPAGRRGAVVHYLLTGWKRGLDPSSAFSTNGYLALHADVRDAGLVPLLHFLERGEEEGRLTICGADYESVSSSGDFSEELLWNCHRLQDGDLFDAEYYAQTTGETFARPFLAAHHYLTVGWKKLADPSARFSARSYMELNPDVAQRADKDPLVHFLDYGSIENRLFTDVATYEYRQSKRLKAVAPSEQAWAELRLTGGIVADNPVCDVIVPVYKGLAETMACIYSVLEHPQKTAFRLVVVNDCSPQAELAELLRQLAAKGLFHLEDLPHNKGFVGAVNTGMRLNADRDVILLNSDAEVFGDWLDRMLAVAETDQNIATVTPFSNNATICSYPELDKDYGEAFELPDAELDKLAARVNEGQIVDLPTGIGFCMYIRRASLQALGDFDEVKFGKGYGEEVDFCRRAIKFGQRNVLAANIFVRHYGSISFGFEKYAQIKRSEEIISDLYPSYRDEVLLFCKSDPTAMPRRRLDRARLKAACGGDAMLMVSHGWGGGTTRHIRELGSALETSGTPVLLCQETETTDTRIKSKEILISRLDGVNFPNLPTFSLEDDKANFIAFLNEVGVRYIHIHQLVGMNPMATSFFTDICATAGFKTFVSLHDYYVVCPRIDFVDSSGLYSGEPDLQACEASDGDIMRPYGYSVKSWREACNGLLEAASAVFVPNKDMAARLSGYFPGVNFTVRPHAVFLGEAPAPRKTPAKGTPRHIVIPGLVSTAKGSAVIRDAAVFAQSSGLPLRFTVFGHTNLDEELAPLSNVSVTGRYEDAQALDGLLELEPDLLWFPSIIPETFSYTLSFAFQTGITPVVFDIGAPAERLKAAGWGSVLPLELMFQPEELCQMLLSLPLEPMPETALEQERKVQTYDNPLSTYYKV